jgi:hypothetical protein
MNQTGERSKDGTELPGHAFRFSKAVLFAKGSAARCGFQNSLKYELSNLLDRLVPDDDFATVHVHVIGKPAVRGAVGSRLVGRTG